MRHWEGRVLTPTYIGIRSLPLSRNRPIYKRHREERVLMPMYISIRSLPLSRSRPIYEALGGEGSYADIYRHKIPPPLKE